MRAKGDEHPLLWGERAGYSQEGELRQLADLRREAAREQSPREEPAGEEEQAWGDGGRAGEVPSHSGAAGVAERSRARVAHSISSLVRRPISVDTVPERSWYWRDLGGGGGGVGERPREAGGAAEARPRPLTFHPRTRHHRPPRLQPP